MKTFAIVLNIGGIIIVATREAVFTLFYDGV